LEILGLILKHDLSWDLQVAKICKRSQFILHNLYRFKQYLSLELKTRLFKQLILPISYTPAQSSRDHYQVPMSKLSTGHSDVELGSFLIAEEETASHP
jgi:hypothetical protein